jgi:hypothetical protein
MCALSVVDQGTSLVGGEPFFGGGFRERLTVQRGSSAAGHGRDEVAVLSPELVLVCPELREVALQQLPEGGPDYLRPRLRLVEPSEHDVVIDGNAGEGLDPPLVVSVLAYAIQESVSIAIKGAAFVAVVSALLLLAVQIFH